MAKTKIGSIEFVIVERFSKGKRKAQVGRYKDIKGKTRYAPLSGNKLIGKSGYSRKYIATRIAKNYLNK